MCEGSGKVRKGADGKVHKYVDPLAPAPPPPSIGAFPIPLDAEEGLGALVQCAAPTPLSMEEGRSLQDEKGDEPQWKV